MISFVRHLTGAKTLSFGLTLAALALVPAKVHAASYTYDLTLTDPTDSTYSGTGVLTITGPNALQTYTPYKTTTTDAVTALSFTIDGTTFNMTDSGVNQSSIIAEFSQLTPPATIYDITFADSIGTGLSRLTLDTTGSYVYYYYSPTGQQEAAYGNFGTATLATGTPEPSSLLLLGTGLLGGAGSLYRRLRSSRA